MIKNIISRKYGWYLARVIASIENFTNIVATSLETIKLYFLSPGNYIKIKCLNQMHYQNQLNYKFIIVPYFRDLIQHYWFLEQVIESLKHQKLRYIDPEYMNELIALIKNLSESIISKKGIKLKELLEFDSEFDKEMKIAMPESWLNENGVDLGEIVLLRNDMPTPIII